MVGAPVPTVGWAVVNVVDKNLTEQPEQLLLSAYDKINEEATATFQKESAKTNVIGALLLVLAFLIGNGAAMIAVNHMVKPIRQMTEDITKCGQTGQPFEMQDKYRTNDEIEVLAESFADLSKKIRKYIQDITAITAEKERISTELALATRIQADMLPNIFPAFPDREEFDIYASMDPAKEVGGDFYDFFMIDSDHLGLVMADVSGKGIPAALFMMISKILIKTRAQSGLSPAQVLKAVNKQICTNNREDMFVTVWLGVLELSTGRLTASNAGHEYPIISSADGSFELFHDRHGFVIGGMSSSKYTDYTIDLAPGSCIFLYTDGVMEAANREGERFGSDRLIKVLNSNSEKTPKEIIEAVSIAADNFSMDTDQFDDITMLCLRYNGESGIRFDSSLNIEAETDFQPRVMDFIDEKLGSYGVGMKDASRIKIASDELFSNVSKFAYRGMEKGDIKVEIGRSDDHRSVFLRFSDSGAPFDPLKGKTPDTTLSADDREIGGLGIFLTRKLMDDVKYEYRNGMNTVTIRKDIDI
jgi:sigma-B regulation protein RsbU (phosphoserine phosphatase)